MIHVLDMQSLFERLELPSQDIDLLAFCGSNKASKVTEWADNLKTTQTLQTCNLLFQVLPQVLRLKTNHIERKLMLDSLFLVAYPSALGLAKEFLNQPLALPESSQKAAILGQTILKSIVTGYLLVFQSMYAEKKLKAPQVEYLGPALFNALQCLGLMQLRNQQLYSQASPLIWQYANALLQIGQHFHVLQRPVKSEFSGLLGATPEQCYLRMVALAAARLNQMTQLDMGHTFNALASWSSVIKFSETPATFWIDIASDSPPTLTERKPAPDLPTVVHVDFSSLTKQLANLVEGEANALGHAIEISIPPEISPSTALHLESAWGRNIARTSQRRASEHTAEIVVGFQLCHSKLSGVQDFGDFIGKSSISQDNGKSGDRINFSTIISALTPRASKISNSSAPTSLRVTTQNVSKEGYCLLWNGVQPIKIDAGDVIAIREHAKREWSIGVIRWIRKLKSHSLIGVQLVTTKPEAVAASCNYSEGGYSDFMRAFLLRNQNGQAESSLLTANILFAENTKIKLKLKDGTTTLAKLTKCQLSTGKVKAFGLQESSEAVNTSQAGKHRL
jgi:hypothetical protein